MRFASLLAITLICASSALCQQVPASSAADSATTATADAPPLHPITPEQVHEILELTNAHRLGAQVVRGMLLNIEKSFPPYVPKDVIDDLNKSLENYNYEPLAIKSYQKHLSTEDAAKVIAFYRTPAGRRLVAVTPQITREMQEGGAKEGARIVQEVIERHMD